MAGNRLFQARPNAWLLDFGEGCRAAVGTRVLVHLLDQPKVFGVPGTPGYCRRVTFWQDQCLPVMDVASRLGLAPQREPRFLAVACYREGDAEHSYFGALQLSAPPVAIHVADSAACALPDQPAAWHELAISCFDFQGSPVPILHLGRVFAPPAHAEAPATVEAGSTFG